MCILYHEARSAEWYNMNAHYNERYYMLNHDAEWSIHFLTTQKIDWPRGVAEWSIAFCALSKSGLITKREWFNSFLPWRTFRNKLKIITIVNKNYKHLAYKHLAKGLFACITLLLYVYIVVYYIIRTNHMHTTQVSLFS